MIVSVFLDLSDLYHRVKRKFDSKIDFAKLDKLIKDAFPGAVNYQFHAYGIERHTEAKRFIAILEKLNFHCQFKKPQICRGYKRANWEIGITLDVIGCDSDVIVLGSGNPDFERLLDQKRCWVLSCDISKALSELAIGIIEIQQEHVCPT